MKTLTCRFLIAFELSDSTCFFWLEADESHLEEMIVQCSLDVFVNEESVFVCFCLGFHA